MLWLWTLLAVVITITALAFVSKTKATTRRVLRRSWLRLRLLAGWLKDRSLAVWKRLRPWFGRRFRPWAARKLRRARTRIRALTKKIGWRKLAGIGAVAGVGTGIWIWVSWWAAAILAVLALILIAVPRFRQWTTRKIRRLRLRVKPGRLKAGPFGIAFAAKLRVAHSDNFVVRIVKGYFLIPVDPITYLNGRDPTWPAIWRMIGAISVIALTLSLTTVWWVGLSTFFVLLGAFIAQGLEGEEAKDGGLTTKPYVIGLMTQWGDYYPWIKKSGLRFYPLKGLWFYRIRVEAETKNLDPDEQVIVTPDHGQVGVKLGINYRANDESPWALIEFVKVGSHDGATDILVDTAQERVRSWGIAKNEGHQDWHDILASGFVASWELLKTLAGKACEVPDTGNVPIRLLLKILGKKQCTKSEIKEWKTPAGREWKKSVKDALTDPKIGAKLQALVDQVEAARSNRAAIYHDGLGVILTRVYIKNIRPAGKLAETIDLRIKEEQEREAETIENEHVRNMILAVMKPVDEGGLGMTREEATLHVRVVIGKTTHNINENRLSFAEATKDVLPKIKGLLAEVLVERSGS